MSPSYPTVFLPRFCGECGQSVAPICPCCGKPAQRNGIRPDGVQAWCCPERQAKRRRAWMAANPKKVAEYQRRSHERRKAREKGGAS